MPVLASIAKLETVGGSPRVPTWSTRLSGLTAIGVVGPALARPGIGTFCDLGQAAALRVEREDVNVVALGVADIDEGGSLRGADREGSGDRAGLLDRVS